MESLCRGGVSAASIGVIAPYRAQLQQIRAVLRREDVDVYTVDRYQGKDKDCVIVSLVRSNPERMVRLPSIHFHLFPPPN